jgi:hypothetical protein
MSDWQRYVDWFLAKYYRCRLRLDRCWCMWRTIAKGHCRWGLHVWRRQVGLVRGTRWLARSSAGRMVARTARWSHGRFLSRASKPRSSRDYVAAESWVAIGTGYHWVPWLIHKAKTEDPKMEVQQHRIGLTGGYRFDRWGAPVWSVCDDAVRRLRSGGHASGPQGLRRG